MSEYLSGVPNYVTEESSFNYTSEIHKSINEYIKLRDQTNRLNQSFRVLGMKEDFTPYTYFDPRLSNLSQKDFKKYYSKKKVLGVPTWFAYNLITGKKYKFKIFKILRVSLIIISGLAIVLAFYYLIKVSFPFLKREWKWVIPVILGFVYFMVNLYLKLKK